MTKRKNGAFNYINLCIKEGNLRAITGWKAKPLTSAKEDPNTGAIDLRNYYVLYNPTPDTKDNPFSEINYLLGTEPYHLSFYEFSHSALAENPNHRNLSYAHGTEYFVPNQPYERQQVLTVHYHFNSLGIYTHTTCKYASGEQIDISAQQEAIFKKRAIQYGIQVAAILASKMQRYLKLAEEIEDIKNKITEELWHGKVRKEYINKKIAECIKLDTIQQSISDKKIDRRTSLRAFINVIEKLLDHSSKTYAQQEPQITNNSLSTVETISPAANPTQDSNPKNIYKNQSQDLLKEQISECTQKLSHLNNLSTTINLQTLSNVIEDYLLEIESLGFELATLSFQETNQSAAQKIKQLFEKIKTLKTA